MRERKRGNSQKALTPISYVNLEGLLMEPCDRKAGGCKLPAATPKTALRPTAAQRQELELLYRQCSRPDSALLQHIIDDNPLLSNLDIHLLKTWFQIRRLKERRDEKLSPLISKNAELKAEHVTLLLLNNQLKSQALSLNLENQYLKEQLEIQLQMKRSANSSKVALQEATDEGYPSDVDDGDSGSHVKLGVCDLELNLSKMKLHQ